MAFLVGLKSGLGSLTDLVANVEVPKYIVIRNFRLGIVLQLLRLMTVGLVLWLVFDEDSYLRQVTPVGRVEMWVDSDEANYTKAATEDLAKPLCKENGYHDYQFDAGGEWIYTGHKCVRKAKEERRGWKEGSDALYIPTAYRETHARQTTAPAMIRDPDGNALWADCTQVAAECTGDWRSAKAVNSISDVPVCECREDANFWVVGVSSVTVGIDHNYQLVQDASWQRLQFSSLYSSQASYASCKEGGRWQCAGRGNELQTVIRVRSQKGDLKEILRMISPGGITLPLQDILDAAGVSLDSPNNQTRENLFRCDAEGGRQGEGCRTNITRFPLIRQTGVEVYLDAEYLNQANIPNAIGNGHRGPLCLITVDVRPKWAAMPNNWCGPSAGHGAAPGHGVDCLYRYYYGMELIFRVSGKFGFFDVVKTAQHLGAGMAYFFLPVLLVSKLAFWCLGPVSQVYKNATYQRVEVDQELASLVANMVSMSHAFRDVAGGSDQITRQALQEEVKSSFGSSNLTADEIRRLTNLVFNQIQDQAELNSVTRPQGDEGGEGGRQGSSAESAGEQAGIDKQHFVSHANRNLSLSQAVEIFDRSRHQSCLERLFRPEMRIRKRMQRNGRDLEVETSVEGARVPDSRGRGAAP